MQFLKCDHCGKEIPIVTKKLFGIEYKVFDTGCVISKEWNIRELFRDSELCKSCADKISLAYDYELLKFKSEVLGTTC